MAFKKNTSVTGFAFMLLKIDGTAVTAGTTSGTRLLDGGTQTAIVGGFTHEGGGEWSVNLTAAEMNGDVVGLKFTNDTANTVPVHFVISTEAVNPEVDMVKISGDATAADNLEAILDGTGATLTLNKFRINANDADGAIDVDNSGGPGMDILGSTFGIHVEGTTAEGINAVSAAAGIAGIHAIGGAYGIWAEGALPGSSGLRASGGTNDFLGNITGSLSGSVNSVTTIVTANVTQLGGVAQSLTDLKDFADAGYDPVTHKVQGVVVVDTTTTNSDMRGTDSALLAASAPTNWSSFLITAGGLVELSAAGVTAIDTELSSSHGSGNWTTQASGSISNTFNVNDSGTPLDGAKVWITTDAAGTNIVASGFTDALGNVTLFLDAGTYYQWTQLAGFNFTNPTQITVA